MTARHILKLAKMGAYNTVNFFRVDQGFVAQTADVVYGRLESCPLDARQMVCLTWLLPATEQTCLCSMRDSHPCMPAGGEDDSLLAYVNRMVCVLATCRG